MNISTSTINTLSNSNTTANDYSSDANSDHTIIYILCASFILFVMLFYTFYQRCIKHTENKRKHHIEEDLHDINCREDTSITNSEVNTNRLHSHMKESADDYKNDDDHTIIKFNHISSLESLSSQERTHTKHFKKHCYNEILSLFNYLTSNKNINRYPFSHYADRIVSLVNVLSSLNYTDIQKTSDYNKVIHCVHSLASIAFTGNTQQFSEQYYNDIILPLINSLVSVISENSKIIYSSKENNCRKDQEENSPQRHAIHSSLHSLTSNVSVHRNMEYNVTSPNTPVSTIRRC